MLKAKKGQVVLGVVFVVLVQMSDLSLLHLVHSFEPKAQAAATSTSGDDVFLCFARDRFACHSERLVVEFWEILTLRSVKISQPMHGVDGQRAIHTLKCSAN